MTCDAAAVAAAAATEACVLIVSVQPSLAVDLRRRGDIKSSASSTWSKAGVRR